MDVRTTIEEALQQRILIIDGAMGTMIQRHKLEEKDYRGERFSDWASDLKGNNDLLVLTQPEIVEGIHREYLEAGADIIETNTFNAQRISMADYHMEDLAFEMNVAAAKLARKAAADYTARNPAKPRFVAGAIGPLTVSLSNSPDADDPGFRVVTFDQVKAAYAHQVRALIAGGSDMLLVETIFDSLNAKAALVAIREVYDQDGLAASGRELPVMISAAVGRGGETLISAQTTEAFWNAVKHVKPLSVGLNCSLGPDLMYPFLEELSEKADVAISCYPNAGLPNPLSETGFDLGPPDMARYLGDFARGGVINIAGGCCGNTPEHIAAIAKALEGQAPRRLDQIEDAA